MQHMTTRRILLVAAAIVALVPTAVQAQATTPLAELLPNLLGSKIILAQTGHEAHFQPGGAALETPVLFNQALAAELSTFPLGSSSGGFTFEIDPSAGTIRQKSTSFGPIFAERALTIGKNKFSFGFNYQHSSYDDFEGKSLTGGEIKFYVQHVDSTGDGLLNPFFEGDLIETALDLKVESDTLSIFVNYGVAEEVDISAAIPVQRVSMDAANNATILRFSTGDVPPNIRVHLFDGPNPNNATFTDSGDASGIGDIILRGKWRFLPQEGGGLAAAMDLRLPTGDEKNLLGVGATQFKPYLIGSWTMGSFAPHFNFGYTFSGESEVANISDEINYTVGFDLSAGPRATFAFDVIGRSLIDSGVLVETTKTFAFRTFSGQTTSTTVQEFELQDGSLNLVLGTAGVKLNIARTMLISASILFPMNDSGLRDKITPVFGIDYAF
jgi:hypothetical protein